MENKNSGWKRVGREMKIDMPFIFRELSGDLLFVGTRVLMVAVGLEIPAELHTFRDMCTSCPAD